MNKRAALDRFFLFLLVLCFLTSCGGGGYVPPPSSSKSPSVSTSKVSRSKLKGWQRPYEINGKRYQPLLSHEGFVERGRASWYGRDFHGKKTSNGEIYDMYAMTAAHKTLPLGVFVKVNNLENGREEVVRVNDRGPFVRGRIIDLSYTAAKKLGVVGPGTAPVKVEALGYRVVQADGTVAYKGPVSYDRGNFSVQIGAFSQEANARRLANKMESLYGASSIQKTVINGTLFHRVRAGKYASLEEAAKAMEKFEKSGYRNCLVVAVE